MKNQQEIIDAFESQIRDIEIAYLKTQDVLAEALEYVRSSRDQYAEDEEQGRMHDLEEQEQILKEKQNEPECG